MLWGTSLGLSRPHGLGTRSGAAWKGSFLSHYVVILAWVGTTIRLGGHWGAGCRAAAATAVARGGHCVGAGREHIDLATCRV